MKHHRKQLAGDSAANNGAAENGSGAAARVTLRRPSAVSELESFARRFYARLVNPSQKPYDDDVPTILRERGFRFFFYMADRFEPPHVHVQRDDCAAKLWLDPLEFAFIEGFRRHEANDILHITEQHRDEFLRAWYQTFGDLSHE